MPENDRDTRRRLKSLDEFEQPLWRHGSGKLARDRIRLLLVIVGGISLGALIGFWLV